VGGVDGALEGQLPVVGDVLLRDVVLVHLQAASLFDLQVRQTPNQHNEHNTTHRDAHNQAQSAGQNRPLRDVPGRFAAGHLHHLHPGAFHRLQGRYFSALCSA
jgi:hypothetical protein